MHVDASYSRNIHISIVYILISGKKVVYLQHKTMKMQ